MIYSQVLVSLEVFQTLRWPLRVAVNHVEGITVLTLAGRVAQASAGQLSAAIREAAPRGDERLILDFEGVDYISSAGLLALESSATRVGEAGGALVLSGIDSPLLTTFRLANVLDRFTVETSKADAIRHLASKT